MDDDSSVKQLSAGGFLGSVIKEGADMLKETAVPAITGGLAARSQNASFKKTLMSQVGGLVNSSVQSAVGGMFNWMTGGSFLGSTAGLLGVELFKKTAPAVGRKLHFLGKGFQNDILFSEYKKKVAAASLTQLGPLLWEVMSCNPILVTAVTAIGVGAVTCTIYYGGTYAYRYIIRVQGDVREYSALFEIGTARLQTMVNYGTINLEEQMHYIGVLRQKTDPEQLAKFLIALTDFKAGDKRIS